MMYTLSNLKFIASMSNVAVEAIICKMFVHVLLHAT